MNPDQAQVQKALSVLMGYAARRETLTYTDLAQELGIGNPRNVGRILYAVADALPDGAPPLTIIVVSKTTGRPSWGMGEVVRDYEQRVDGLQEAVFNYDWHQVGREL